MCSSDIRFCAVQVDRSRSELAEYVRTLMRLDLGVSEWRMAFPSLAGIFEAKPEALLRNLKGTRVIFAS
jgi:hypothetical protein